VKGQLLAIDHPFFPKILIASKYVNIKKGLRERKKSEQYVPYFQMSRRPTSSSTLDFTGETMTGMLHEVRSQIPFPVLQQTVPRCPKICAKCPTKNHGFWGVV